MLILPAIDLIRGRCVRLVQGDYAQETVYHEDPAAVAKDFEDQGTEWLHVVDLDGAKAGAPQNLDAIRRIAEATSLKIELGGGIRTDADIQAAFDSGVTRVVLGSVLVRDLAFAEKVLGQLGDRVVAGIDARNGRVAVSGWIDTSEVTAQDLAVRMAQMGARRIILTDIARDGMLTGPNYDLLQEVAEASKLPIIQSGGIAELSDLVKLAQLPTPPEGTIVGKAIYERRFTVKEAIEVVRQ